MDDDLPELQNLKLASETIRKQNRSLGNRIQSILYDAKFVTQCGVYFGLPLVANKRCGTWYIDPAAAASSCYFKSTDGHTHQWSFSTRRLNLHLLPLIKAHAGIVVVDSTRRGKCMPDAASKTIPIWCAVLNFVNGFDAQVWTPPQVVSRSERDQMMQLVPQWAETLKQLGVDTTLDKPLRPLWFVHGDEFQDEPPKFTDFYPVVICTASFQAQDGQASILGWSYVQGAADDHELWAGSLTPEKLWSTPELHDARASDEHLASIISGLPDLQLHNDTTHVNTLTLTHTPLKADCVIDVRQSAAEWALQPGKKGARMMAAVLGPVCDYFERHGPYATIVSDANTDFGPCIALMLDCLFFDLNGVHMGRRSDHVPKDEVNKRLAKISSCVGFVPSRTTLNIIGSFLRR